MTVVSFSLPQKGVFMSNLKEIFYYDETSPSFLRWNIEVRAGKNYNIIRANKGDVAGSKDNLNYFKVKYGKIYERVHRVIWQLFFGKIPDGFIIDHVDGNPSNNNVQNLALKTIAENTRNSKKNSRNTSGYVGVSYLKTGYWRAQWHIGDKIESKYFSVKTYGNSDAKNLAIKAREEGILKLNILGYKYTERHGND